MKKIALFLAALMLVMCLAACGGNSGGSGSDAGSDLAYVQDKGAMIVGMTDFAPMDYRDESGEWIGFDADMAKAFAGELGVDVKFVELADWDKKSLELDAKSIDVVWNGMTLTDDVKELMGTSEAYCENKQVVVTKAGAAAGYKSVDDIKELSFAVENGSAGAEALDAEGITGYTVVDTQAKALMEVASGSSDACVIDLLMAGAMIGEGTDYDELAMTEISLTDEQYGVGFRKGSDLVDAFNTFWKKAYDDGTVMETAEKYGIAQNIIAK